MVWLVCLLIYQQYMRHCDRCHVSGIEVTLWRGLWCAYLPQTRRFMAVSAVVIYEPVKGRGGDT